MDQFNTVQSLLDWNSQPQREEGQLTKSEELALEIIRLNDTGIALDTVKLLLRALVSYHKKVVNFKREDGNIQKDIDIWAYDWAQLNAALTIIQDVEGEAE
jgi:hypothetical protein